MARKLKLLTGLSTVALTGALVLSGCGAEGEGESEAGHATPDVTAQGEGETEGEGAVSAEGEGESEGEGEGESEGSGVVAGDPATDDVEYIKRLGLVRGHLLSFMELYRTGNYDMALSHAKHPESELYTGLVPAFQVRSKAGFANELEELSQAAIARGDVEVSFERVMTAIITNMPKHDSKTALLAVSQMVSTAADEFTIGVSEDGSIVNAHEYQDAHGFLMSAREVLASEDTNDINAAEAIAIAHEQLDAALLSFDGLVVQSTEGKASTLYGAASRIEIAALGL